MIPLLALLVLTTTPLEHVQVLASDAMGGRGLGQPGHEAALAYAESVMVEVGLEPIMIDRSGDPTYRQEVPVVRYRFGPSNRFRLQVGGETLDLVHGDGMLVFRPGQSAPVGNAGVAFVGYGVHEPEFGYDDYEGVDVAGHWVAILEGTPSNLPPELRSIYGDKSRSGDRIAAALIQKQAVGLIVIAESGLYESWDLIAEAHRKEVFAAGREYLGGNQMDTDFPIVLLGTSALETLFSGSRYHPLSRTGDGSSRTLPGVSLSLSADFERSVILSYNLVGRQVGAITPDESIVVSAHIDHLGEHEGEVYNGANDDASGCAVVLTTAERMQRTEVGPSVDYVLFTGEEMGHFGSLHYLADPPPGRILASINLEHVGQSGDGTLLTTATPDLLGKLEPVREQYSEVMRLNRLDPGGNTIRGSDSFSFFLHDVPVAITGGGTFPEYHTPGDDIEFIQADVLENAIDLTVSMILALAR